MNQSSAIADLSKSNCIKWPSNRLYEWSGTVIEKEIKVLLTKEQYNKALKLFHWDQVIDQTNYYYLDPDQTLKNYQVTVRIREKNGQYKLQIKYPSDQEAVERFGEALSVRSEYERQVDNIPDLISRDVIKEVTGISASDPLFIGELKTVRHKYNIDQYTEIFLDKSEYLGITDYEMEIEFVRTVEHSLIEFLKESGIEFNQKAIGKFNRFLTAYEARN